jgi:hypothetical protein
MMGSIYLKHAYAGRSKPDKRPTELATRASFYMHNVRWATATSELPGWGGLTGADGAAPEEFAGYSKAPNFGSQTIAIVGRRGTDFRWRTPKPTQ